MNRTVVAFSLSLLPFMISSGMMYSVLPIYISKELGANVMETGMLFTTGATVGLFTSIIIGKIADRFGKKPLILLSQMLFALVMLIYSIITDFVYAYPIHVLEGFAWASLGVAYPALLADVAKKGRRGEAFGIYNTVWNMGWVIGPILGGTLAHFFGFRLMLRISAIMILVGLIIAMVVIREESSQ